MTNLIKLRKMVMFLAKIIFMVDMVVFGGNDDDYDDDADEEEDEDEDDDDAGDDDGCCDNCLM